MNAQSGERANEIEHDIDRTRHQMDCTLDALAERLNPRYIMREYFGAFAGGMVRGAARDLGTRSWHAVRNHPIPSALIGAGLAWLGYEGGASLGHLFSRKTSRRRGQVLSEPQATTYSGSYVDARTGQAYEQEGALYGQDIVAGAASIAGPPSTEPGPQVSQPAGEVRRSSGEAMSTRRQKAGGIMSQAQRRASDTTRRAKQQLQQKASFLSGRARNMAANFGQQLSRAASSTGEGVKKGSAAVGRQVQQGYQASRDAIVRAADEYPLSVGLGLLAVGALVGLAIPATPPENRMMGRTSDRTLEKAKSKGKELLQRGRRVASATANAAIQEARAQGLTPEAIAEKAKTVAREARDAATEAAEHESAGQGDEPGPEA